jgi:CHAT domain-containing protein
MYFRHLRGQFYDCTPDQHLTTGLVRALAIQVELELGDADQDIEEIADLCDELFNSGVSREFLALPIMAFISALLLRFGEPLKGEVVSEKAINCLRKATVQRPDLHDAFFILAISLLARFQITFSEDEYKEGMAILDKVMNFSDPEGTPNRLHNPALIAGAIFPMIRFHVYGEPEYLEQAIYRVRTILDRISPEHAYRPMFIGILSMLQGWRHYDPSVKANIQDASPGFVELPSFRDLIAALPELKTSKSLPDLLVVFENPHEDPLKVHYKALQHSSIDRLTDIADIEDGIEYCRQLNAYFPDSHLARDARRTLSYFSWHAFKRTDEMKYLNKTISVARDHINTSDTLMARLCSLRDLTTALSLRLLRLRRREDLDELMQLFPTVAKYECGRLHHQDLASARWASIARGFGHPSALTAYNLAMSSMQLCLTLAPTLDKQHSRLVVMDDDLKTLPLDCASYQMSAGQPEQAIETLERGRALLWSEMRGFRITLDQIRSADCHLAEKFATVSRDLEALTLALDNVDGGNSVPKGMDPFGHLVVRQQRLLDEREKLILEIQALPGLDTFLKPHSYATLCGAARHGPIIIINHSIWRSDIVILLHNSPPSLITTSKGFYARANKLQGLLLGERRQPEDLESNKYNDALSFVLKELYELVGRPVIKRLNELNVPLQSRLWWCPTSVFCSLPLHAMGPIPSDWERPQYFLDLYIPSYAPSLLSLIESRKSGLQTFDKPSMLVIAQPDATMMQALEEVRVVQAVSPRVTTLVAAAATPPAVLERIRDHRFAHIVCHGILEPGKPLDSCFKLFNGQRLSLLDVVRSRLPDAEFAFLSACHTAELTDQSPADEALHLAAAMQFCGFRSVVGTMWAMADPDGPALAGDFYKSVFSGRKEGVPYYERTARALRDAVVKLRRKRGITLERWVNYVHFGA